MTTDTIRTLTAPVAGLSPAARRTFVCLLLIAFALILPWLFYDWGKGRHAGFEIKMFSQMGLLMIFALSFNMLMGQAGLLSFGHAAFFGLGGYCTAHVLNGIGGGGFPLPVELVPLAGGLGALIFSVVLGWLITKQRATAFAMITLGIGELVTACALMFKSFFGGEGGVTTDRMVKTSPFGFTYAQDIQVYYLIVAWAVISIGLMWLLTQTPLGRMANACRDNHERAQFVGYDPRMVRFYQFALSGFFAGIGGALYAMLFEIVTYDAVAAVMSGNALLMTFIGGAGVFYGPIIGTVLIVLLQTKVSLLSAAWPVYVGVLFIIMVMFAPMGIGGLLQMHQPLLRGGRLNRLVVPYLRVLLPALLLVAGFVVIVELLSFISIGRAQGKTFGFFGTAYDASSPLTWLAGVALFAAGAVGVWYQGSHVRRTWEVLIDEMRREETAP